MHTEAMNLFAEFVDNIYLLMTALVFAMFGMMGYLSSRHSLYARKKAGIGDISQITSSPLAPSITIIAPAYNESLTIVENVRSLLSLRYVNYEVMVINDGSTDDTLQKLIEAYDLEHYERESDPQGSCKPIKSVYRSRKRSFDKLTVIDKVKGGKSDALNTGIQLSRSTYIGCIDVDCLLHPDALLHVVRGFFQRSRKRVIAVGGVIRVANSCKIRGGTLEKIRLPKSWLARFQVLEYTRSFLLGRMAWGRVDSLMIISGAFGFFDREIAREVGGYDVGTVGEDLEIVFRMRRHMRERKMPYAIEYLPDPLCWTEVPEDLNAFVNQRDRWSRGNLETLSRHRRMFMNPKFGRLGMLSYPYWFFYEWLSPLLEFLGLLTVLLFWYLGVLNTGFFLAITATLYAFAVMFSLFAILWEVWTYNQYSRIRDIGILIGCALLEPLVFHPIVVWSSVRGNFRKLFRLRAGWGPQVRKGFVRA